jgi:hypothetical protein
VHIFFLSFLAEVTIAQQYSFGCFYLMLAPWVGLLFFCLF